MAYTERLVHANGIRLHYLDWGGDGPPLLFLHPTGFHAHIWEPFAERLAPRFRCFALDTRGHGDSDKPGEYGWTDFADDLEGFLDALGLSGVAGIGHSAGATSITIVGARRPELFSRAVLIDPILFFDRGTRPWQQADSTMQAAARRRRMEWPSHEAALQNYAAKPPFDAWDRRLLELYVRHGMAERSEPAGTASEAGGRVVLKCSGEDEAKMYAWGPRPLHSEEYLGALSVPVLLIAGERSFAFPADKVRQAAALIRNSRVVTVPGASHFVPFERPAEVEAAIDGFLGLE